MGDCVRTRVVSHLNAEATQLAMAGIYSKQWFVIDTQETKRGS